jgi:hypothetical protein
MSVTVHFVSADGSSESFEHLPATPARIRAPAGALVEVVDDDSGEDLRLTIVRDRRHCRHTDFSILDEPVLSKRQ